MDIIPHDTSILANEGEKILTGLRDVGLDPTAVDYLFNANQLLLTKPQRAVVIESIRRHRAEREQKRAARAATRDAKKKLTPDEKNKLTLDDLGELDLNI